MNVPKCLLWLTVWFQVERLVEDATLAGGAAAAVAKASATGHVSRGDYKDKIFIEKLKCLDDSHSEKTG